MTFKLDVPDDRLGAFQRMKRQLPLDIREDPEVLTKMLIYLKLGGERLVRQLVATLKTEFPEDTQLFKRRIADESLEDGDVDEDVDSDQVPASGDPMDEDVQDEGQ